MGWALMTRNTQVIRLSLNAWIFKKNLQIVNWTKLYILSQNVCSRTMQYFKFSHLLIDISFIVMICIDATFEWYHIPLSFIWKSFWKISFSISNISDFKNIMRPWAWTSKSDYLNLHLHIYIGTIEFFWLKMLKIA